MRVSVLLRRIARPFARDWRFVDESFFYGITSIVVLIAAAILIVASNVIGIVVLAFAAFAIYATLRARRKR